MIDPKKTDIRIRIGPWTNENQAAVELYRAGYKRRPESNDLPVKFERENYPARTIMRERKGRFFKIAPYPSDAEIYRAMPDRIDDKKLIKDPHDDSPDLAFGQDVNEALILGPDGRPAREIRGDTSVDVQARQEEIDEAIKKAEEDA